MFLFTGIAKAGCSNGSQCAASVVAFALSLVKDGLQQFGEGCDGRLCAGIMSDTSQRERVFNFLEVSGSVCVFRERRRPFAPDICAADVAPRDQTF